MTKIFIVSMKRGQLPLALGEYVCGKLHASRLEFEAGFEGSRGFTIPGACYKRVSRCHPSHADILAAFLERVIIVIDLVVDMTLPTTGSH